MNKSQQPFFKNFYILQECAEKCQKIQKPGPTRAVFTTVYLCVKLVSKPEVVQI